MPSIFQFCRFSGLDDPSAFIELAYEVCEYFGISLNQARETAIVIGHVVARWRNETRRFGLSSQEIDRMATAFEHEDLEVVLMFPAKIHYLVLDVFRTAAMVENEF